MIRVWWKKGKLFIDIAKETTRRIYYAVAGSFNIPSESIVSLICMAKVLDKSAFYIGGKRRRLKSAVQHSGTLMISKVLCRLLGSARRGPEVSYVDILPIRPHFVTV